MTRAKRTPPEVRKQHILKEAIKLSIKIGYNKITRDGIAEHTKVTSSLIARYYPTMDDVRRAVIEEAIKNEIVEILAQGLALKDPLTLKINKRLKRKVLSRLSDIT